MQLRSNGMDRDGAKTRTYELKRVRDQLAATRQDEEKVHAAGFCSCVFLQRH